MRGRADVLAAAGRRAEAADILDRLAAILERDGRLADAAMSPGEPSSWPSRAVGGATLQSLVARLRSQTGDTAAAQALARALGVLETVPGAAIVEAVAAGDGADGSGRRRRPSTCRRHHPIRPC